MNSSLLGKVAIVTGATAGIGKEIALTFLQSHATVIAVGTNEERGKLLEAEAEIISKDKLHFFKVDISSKEAVDKLIQTVIEKFQKIDILVNNAGITKDGLLLKMAQEDWDKVIAVNLTSSFYTCQAVLRSMLKSRYGKIINISSVVGLMGNPGQCNYAASKAGIIGFSKSLAKEVASRNIYINCIAPGFIETPMTEALHGKKEEIIKQIPLGRYGKPEEIAQTALFLASSQSDYITGQVITVDGGLAM